MHHFLGGAFKGDLNRTNPLGMSGELAEAFGHLMHNLWKGDVSVVAPRSFKAKVGSAGSALCRTRTALCTSLSPPPGTVAGYRMAHIWPHHVWQ